MQYVGLTTHLVLTDNTVSSDSITKVPYKEFGIIVIVDQYKYHHY